MKKRRLALLALVLTMVLITAFPMTALAAESGNWIWSWGGGTPTEEALSNTHFPMAITPLCRGTVEIQYTTSGNPISYVEVDGERVIPYDVRSIYYQVVPGVYRYEQHFKIDVDDIISPSTTKSLITFATGNNLYGINVRWQ